MPPEQELQVTPSEPGSSSGRVVPSFPPIVWAIGGLILGGIIAGIATYFLTPHASVAQTPTVVSSTTETIAQEISIDYTFNLGGIRDYPAKVAVSTPIDWRAQTTLRDRCGAVFYHMQTCFGLQLADAIGQPKQMIGTNSLELRNITDWLAVDTKADGSGPLPYGLETAKDKKAALDVLFNAQSSDDLKQYKKLLLNPLGTGSFLGNFAHLEKITTSDGVFSGYLVLDSVGTNPVYLPTAYVVLAGKFKDQTMILQGKFDIHDKKRDELKNETDNTAGSKIDLALKAAQADKFPADTIGLLGPIKTAVQSFHLTER